jgi:predicted TIM-barrel fold metal-dependent hydrolase
VVKPGGMLIENHEVAQIVERHPDRFAGVASVDLTRPVAAVRELRRAVNDFGFVALRIVPWVWDLLPDDRRYYPLYAACVELDIPFCTQVGHTGPLCPSEPGRPIPYLDRVLVEFPELVVVGGHVGYPWMDEVISLATKYPNFYVDTSAYVVHRLPSQLVEFLRGRGRSRVLFGTNWPMLSATRCLEGSDSSASTMRPPICSSAATRAGSSSFDRSLWAGSMVVKVDRYHGAECV